MGNKYVIVLTACINPGKMIHTSLTDVDIRRRQYEDALEFYLLQTDYPIVFVENSGTDISGDFRKFVERKRICGGAHPGVCIRAFLVCAPM